MIDEMTREFKKYKQIREEMERVVGEPRLFGIPIGIIIGNMIIIVGLIAVVIWVRLLLLAL